MKYVALGLLLALNLAIALNNGYELLFRLDIVLLALLAGGYLWTRWSLSQVEGRLEGGDLQSQVGQHIGCKLIIHNKGRWPRLWLELRLNSNLPGAPGGRVVNLPGERVLEENINMPCRRRGQYHLGPLELTSRDPFGLFEQRRTLPGGYDVLVYPAFLNIHSPEFSSTGILDEGNLPRSLHSSSAQASGLREYHPGDSLHHIHWLSSARTGRLMVKEFETNTPSQAWLVLDMEARVQAGQGDSSTEEDGVSLAASLAKLYLEGGLSLGLLAWGEQPYILEPGAGPGHLRRILETLSLARAMGTTPLSYLLGAEEVRWGQGDSLIVITPSGEESWVFALRQKVAQGAAAAAFLVNGSGQAREGIYDTLWQNGIPAYSVNGGRP